MHMPLRGYPPDLASLRYESAIVQDLSPRALEPAVPLSREQCAPTTTGVGTDEPSAEHHLHRHFVAVPRPHHDKCQLPGRATVAAIPSHQLACSRFANDGPERFAELL